MRRLAIGVSAAVLLLAILLGPSLLAPGPRGLTWLELTAGATGRRIFAGALADGEEIVLTWKNSLFGLRVTEVFVARAGRLDLTRVTFADSQGPPRPLPSPKIWTIYTIRADRSMSKGWPARLRMLYSGLEKSATPS